MKVLIIVFSPAGSTLKIAEGFQKKLIAEKHQVQLVNITGNKSLFSGSGIKDALSAIVKDHDVICIGSPVYEKHLEFYIRKIFKSLPKPDSKWGKFAIPFVTYGGISSGMALLEADKLFKKSGRQVIAAMKIETVHIITKRLKTKVNEGMPGKEALPVIDELVKRITAVEKNNGARLSNFASELNYHTFKEKALSFAMNEMILHKYKYPAFTVDYAKCNKCLNCVKKCSIQRIDIDNGSPKMDRTKPDCIHCFACVNSCPVDAITFVRDDKDWGEIERILKLVSAEKSFFRSMENVRSAVYPIRLQN